MGLMNKKYFIFNFYFCTLNYNIIAKYFSYFKGSRQKIVCYLYFYDIYTYVKFIYTWVLLT